MQAILMVAQLITVDSIAKDFSAAFGREVQALLHRPDCTCLSLLVPMQTGRHSF